MLLDQILSELPGLYLAPDTGGASGGGGGNDSPPEEDNDNDDDGSTKTDDGTGAQKDQNAGKVEFTEEQQAHVDRIIGERLERARAKWQAEQEKARQEAEAQAEKERLQAEKEAEEQRLAEEAKWQELAEKRQREVEEAQAERDQALAALRDLHIRRAVEIAAGEARFIDPDDAFRLVDLSAVEIDEDGQVTGVEEALKALVEAKPHLVEPEEDEKPPALGTPGHQQRSPTKPKQAQREERRKRPMTL